MLLLTVIITPASGGFIVNGIAQAVVLPNSTTTTVQVTPQSGSASNLTTTSSLTHANSAQLGSAPVSPKAGGTSPVKPKKTGSLALFFRKVSVC